MPTVQQIRDYILFLHIVYNVQINSNEYYYNLNVNSLGEEIRTLRSQVEQLQREVIDDVLKQILDQIEQILPNPGPLIQQRILSDPVGSDHPTRSDRIPGNGFE